MILPEPADVLAAAGRLAGVANQTPVLTSRTLDERCGGRLFLKCENFQRAGAFKFRGAYNALSKLSAADRAAGVITHSSGNHAQALALAASLLGVRAVVVMPEDAPRIKRDATAGYGAEIVPCPALEREEVTARLIAEHGYTLIHPYDNTDIIAGQGTAALELFEETGPLDLLLVPVGGGGLISGSALAASLVSPGCRVVGVEPARGDDANRSWRQGEIVTLPEVPDTIADGLRTRHIGERNLALMRQHVADMTTATEDEIRAAVAFLWQRLKIVVEPSSAVALAPLLSGRYPAEGQRVGVILSGGNVDFPAADDEAPVPVGRTRAPQALLEPHVELRPRVLVTARLDGDALELLQSETEVDVHLAPEPDTLMELIGGYQALVVDDHTLVKGQAIEYGFRLRAIGSTASRLDNIDVSAARSLGVEVIASPAADAVALAEYTLSLLLSLPEHSAGKPVDGLAGKTLGLIGFGRIAKHVAERALAFDMRVLVNQPRLTPELALAAGIQVADLPRLLRESDYVSLHLPHRGEAETLLGPAELALMKPSAYLINTAHTDLIDDEALLAALNGGCLAAAALGTFVPTDDDAPIRPSAALLRHPRVMTARHITSFAAGRSTRDAVALVRKILATLHTRRPHESLSLDVVPVEKVTPHEAIDDKRVNRLMARLESDGRLVNPPVVAAWRDRYVILDGATRFTALRRLGYPHVIVQIVSAESQEFTLHTWYHVISADRPFDDLLARLREIEGLALTPRPADALGDELRRTAAICYLQPREGPGWLLQEAPGADRLALMNAIVDCYTRWGAVERTLLTDLARLQGQFPDMVAVAVFPQFRPEEVFEVAGRGQYLPAGLTRFLIPGRVLRLNADLGQLKRPEPLAAKRAWLNEILADKLARSRLRYYQEPVVLLDE